MTFLSTKGSEVSPGDPSALSVLSINADLFMIMDTKRSYFSSCLSKPRKQRVWEGREEEHTYQSIPKVTLQTSPRKFMSL